MQVRMKLELLTPRMKREYETGTNTQPSGGTEQGKDAESCGTEQGIPELLLVVAPQRQQLVRDGEDELEVSRRKKAALQRIEPTGGARSGAGGTGTVAAGVVVYPANVPFGTEACVGAESRCATAADGDRGAVDASRQLASGGVRRKDGVQDALDRQRHGSYTSYNLSIHPTSPANESDSS
jgi:hypothetical protein